MNIVCNPIFSTRNYPSQDDDLSCFAIMPFHDDVIQEVYTEYTKPTIEEAGIKCIRGDDIFSTSSIMEDIFAAICRANVIIGEFTGRNPNVLYEAGIAHTLGKPLIGITQNIEDVPFDLRSIRHIVYKTTPSGLKQFKEALKNTLSAVMSQKYEMYPQVFSEDKEVYKELLEAYIRNRQETDRMYSSIEQRILNKYVQYNEKIRALSAGRHRKIAFSETGIQMVRVDSAFIDVDYYDDDHKLINIAKENISEFFISKTPVTNAQYQVFVQATGHPCPDHWEGGHCPIGQDQHPVIGVSWVDVVMFCRWLTELCGREMDIPSEAQWLAAAGYGKDKRKYPWGVEWVDNSCNSREFDRGKRQITDVDYFKTNESPYGCLDMLGNVWEWTNSAYDYDNNSGFQWRAVRGGANYTKIKDTGVLARLVAHPGHFLFVHDLGFRVVRNID